MTSLRYCLYILDGDGSIFHLHIRPEQLADKVVLVGDPGRVSMFKPIFDAIECEGSSREFVWATGTYKGTRITALSTGIGTDNIDIVMTELDALANIDFETREVKPEHKTLTIVRLGTCGALQPEIPLGAFILSHYSIGFDGLLGWYADRESITNLEMEGSAIAGIASHLGHEAITVCCAIAHRYLKDANTDYKVKVAELVQVVMDKLAQ